VSGDRRDAFLRARGYHASTIGGRPGDEQAAVPNTGISWAELAARYRRRAAQ